jgi:hypothetical protein
MSNVMRTFGVICAVAAFVLCLVGGLWILREADFGDSDDALSIGIGLYCTGKAFFVGPMLIIASLQASRVKREA